MEVKESRRLTWIHSQWNSTFGTTPIPASTQPPLNQAPLKAISSGALELPTLPEMQQQAQHSQQQSLNQNHVLPNPILGLPNNGVQGQQQYSGASIPSFVTPSMWQESVSSVYNSGLKRAWEYDDHHMGDPGQKRR